MQKSKGRGTYPAPRFLDAAATKSSGALWTAAEGGQELRGEQSHPYEGADEGVVQAGGNRHAKPSVAHVFHMGHHQGSHEEENLGEQERHCETD